MDTSTPAPRGNSLALVNGYTPQEYMQRTRALALATAERKSYQFGGGNPGYDFGSAWLTGAYDFALGAKERYKVALDDLVDSSIVMLCIHWIQRTAPEAPLVVAKKKPDRTMGDIQDDHPMSLLVEYPNEYYPGESLWQSTYLSLNLSGNAYWLKIRNGARMGPPLELWYEPHFSIRPVRGKARGELISGYQLFRDGRWLDPIPREDVVHFRSLGCDPRNPLLGINPLATSLREVFTDTEAAIFTATLLKNMGVTNMVVSPQKGDIIENVGDLVRLLIAKTTGDHKGEPMVWSEPLQVDYPAMGDTAKVAATEVRQIPQERIPALLGLNRLAVGIGQDGTYSNVGEAREAAVENNLLPTFRVLSKQLDAQLLPDFTGQPPKEAALGCFFVTSAMRVLSEDQDALSTRTLAQLLAGAISVNEARQATGFDPLKGADGDVYYVPSNVTVMETPASASSLQDATAAPEMAPAPSLPDAGGSTMPPDAMPMMDLVPLAAPAAGAGAAQRNGHG